MKILSEKRVRYKDIYAGTVDIICGIDDFGDDLEFDESKHLYHFYGIPLVSVTQLLDTGQYDGVNKKVLDRASKRGTEIHAQVELFLKTGITSDSWEFKEFLRIFETYHSIFESKCIIDIKTYASMNDKMKSKADAQTTMYRKAVEYLTHESGFDRYILWLPKEPKRGRIIKLYD